MVALAEPIAISTSLGTRELVDVSGATLDLQKLENPVVSLHQCATRFGHVALQSLFLKLAQRGEVPTFEEINLADNNIGDEGARLLRETLAGNTSLKRLLLPRAAIGADGLHAVGGVLGESCLEALVVSGNICGAEGCGGAFAAGLARNATLMSLSLAACRIGDGGVELLCASALREHPTLAHLSLQYNRLEAASAISLSRMLAVNQALRHLDLSGNSLGAEGAQALVDGLAENGGRLRRLSVAQNEARLQGCAALARHFATEAQALDAPESWYCPEAHGPEARVLSPSAMKYYCPEAQGPDGQGLEFLDLRHNSMTYGCVVQIREMLGRPMEDDNGSWMLLFNGRQLCLNAH